MKSKVNIEEVQKFANRRYFFRKLNSFSAPFANTVEEVLEKYPKLTEDQARGIVFQASINSEEQD